MKEIINKLINKENLTQKQMEFAMNEIMEGRVSESILSSFLTSLKIKGETFEEIMGSVNVMRNKATPLNNIDPYTVDIVGTGGDGHHTFNISTASCFILAAAGVTITKHGNRSVSSKCGSADVLESLGIKISLSPDSINHCINKTSFGFLFAPKFHGAMKHAIKVRNELGFRTIFNLLGPLTNPSNAKGFFLGVFDEKLTETFAEILKNLGAERALVVHGLDGLDEISISTKTKITELKNNKITTYYIEPQDFGINTSSLKEIVGGNSIENSEIIKGLLRGEITGPKLDILLLNSGAALYVGKKVESIKEGIAMAKKLIQNGLAYEKLLEIIKYSNCL